MASKPGASRWEYNLRKPGTRYSRPGHPRNTFLASLMPVSSWLASKRAILGLSDTLVRHPGPRTPGPRTPDPWTPDPGPRDPGTPGTPGIGHPPPWYPATTHGHPGTTPADLGQPGARTVYAARTAGMLSR